MVYVRRDKAAGNRHELLSTAGRLFRERGIDGVGVAQIAREAKLTHGALYAHFSSKDDLAAEAFSQGLERSRDAFREAFSERDRDISSLLDYFLSASRRDNPGMSCPMTASASEIGRQNADISARFASGFSDKVAAFEALIDKSVPAAKRRCLAITAVTAEIGAMAAARAVCKAAPELSDQILEAVKAVMTEAFTLDRL